MCWTHQVAFKQAKLTLSIQQRLSDLTGPYWSTYGIVDRVLQPLLDCCIMKMVELFD